MKYLLVVLAVLMLAGCEDQSSSYASRLNQLNGYTNAHEVGRGYIMYDIENGTVTCREHTRRSELTCWLNRKGMGIE